jgi:nitrogen fixation NifU-like protein
MELLVEGTIVREAGFAADACAVCVASASVLTELVAGAPLDEVETLTTDDIIRQLDAALPKTRMACAALPLTVLHSGLAMYRKETSIP